MSQLNPARATLSEDISTTSNWPTKPTVPRLSRNSPRRLYYNQVHNDYPYELYPRQQTGGNDEAQPQPAQAAHPAPLHTPKTTRSINQLTETNPDVLPLSCMTSSTNYQQYQPPMSLPEAPHPGASAWNRADLQFAKTNDQFFKPFLLSNLHCFNAPVHTEKFLFTNNFLFKLPQGWTRRSFIFSRYFPIDSCYYYAATSRLLSSITFTHSPVIRVISWKGTSDTKVLSSLNKGSTLLYYR